jgi:uncharacterized phage-associated protein
MSAANRNKLLHAIVFFAKNTRHCHKLKLYKLLFFLDFEIFRQTGKSTTGLFYFAWPKGPVPRQLQNEFRAPLADMRSVISLHFAPADDPDANSRLDILPRVRFDESHFTGRELDTMERLAEIFRDADGYMMTEASHQHGDPWDKIYRLEGRAQALIPYALALDDKRPDTVTKEWADEVALESRAIASLFN